MALPTGSKVTFLLSVLLLWQVTVLARQTGFSASLLASAFTPAAGARESLPESVLEAAQLLARHGVRTFKLGKPLADDPLFLQRIVEYAYPARLADAAAARLVVRDAAVPDGCRAIESGTRISLHVCD
jgi:hypothetical protein